jgi:hypothetical protein
MTKTLVATPDPAEDHRPGRMCVECGKYPQVDCWSICMLCLQWALDEGWPLDNYKARP